MIMVIVDELICPWFGREGTLVPNMADHNTFPDSFIGKSGILSTTTETEKSYSQTDKQTLTISIPSPM